MTPGTGRSGDGFIRALNLRDVVLMNVVAVVGLRWIARGARTGPASVTLWILAWVAFFIPLAVACSALAKRYPEQGGVYSWVRRAFGTGHGFICGWCLWVNNLFYFPSLLLFGAANFAAMGGARWEAVGATRWYAVTFVLAGIWIAAGINIIGLRVGKWLQNAGSLGVWIPVGLLMGCGAFAFARFGSATPFTADSMIPRGNLLDTVGLWSAMCFAFSGFEISSLMGQEIVDPERTIPRGIFIAGAATTVIYIAGSASVLIAVPLSSLKELSGITDAVQLVAGRVGITGLGALTGGLLALNALAGTASWTAGAARVPFAAGVDSAMPKAFARLHPRYRTPYVALIVQSIAASAIFLASVFFSVSGRVTSIQEAYDILVNLTILIYFVPYLYLFAAQIRLLPDSPRALALLGFAATAISLALTFVPPPGSNALTYEVNLIAQATIMLGLGVGLYLWSRPRNTRTSPPGAER
ncbi:MAG TPA: APC family permease [Vicinamibacterales bacterium]|nr:APC family permease [Vicinamibacterales bacterium]